MYAYIFHGMFNQTFFRKMKSKLNGKPYIIKNCQIYEKNMQYNWSNVNIKYNPSYFMISIEKRLKNLTTKINGT